MYMSKEGLFKFAIIFILVIIYWKDPLLVQGDTSSDFLTVKLVTATYYIDATSGNDNNDGRSPGTAWKSIARVNRSGFNPGDSILFKRGEIWPEGSGLIPSSSGSAGKLITFGSYGSGDLPIIKAPSGTIYYVYNTVNQKHHLKFSQIRFDGGRGQFSHSGIILGVMNDSYELEFSDCEFVNSPVVATASGIYLDSTHNGDANILITRNSFDHTETAIYNQSTSGVTITHNTITNSTSGICAGAYTSRPVNNITVSHNDVSGWGSGVAGTKHAIWVYLYSAPIGAGDNYIIADNYAHNPTGEWDAIELTWNTKPAHITIARNRVTHNGQALTDGFGIVVNLLRGGQAEVYSNSVYDTPFVGIFQVGGSANIYRNRIKNCGYSANTYWSSGIGVGSSNSEAADVNGSNIYYNIVDSCHRSISMLGEGPFSKVRNVHVYNNVFYNPAEYNARLTKYCENILFKNNIFYSNSKPHEQIDARSRKGFVSDHNCFFNDYAAAFTWGEVKCDFSDWKKVSGQDLHSLGADPRFVNAPQGNFHLRKDSPCREAGTSMEAKEDYYGKPVPAGQAPDIGVAGVKAPK